MGTHKTPRQIFMESHPEFTIAARKKFRVELKDSSVGSAPDSNTGIVFFEAFQSYLIKLDEQDGIYIRPICWAKAFLQKDIASVAKVLCAEVFSETDLHQRNQGRPLDFVKQAHISRVSKWMMKKDQDPWSYEPGPWPTVEEQNEINEVFRTFTTVNSIPDEIPMPEGVTSDSYLASIGAVAPNGSIIEDKLTLVDHGIVRILENTAYKGVFRCIMEYGKQFEKFNLGNSAQTARELTKITIPNITDVFVDAVQFTKVRWAKALLSRDITTTAEILFRKFWKTDFCDLNKPFNTVDELCPVKWLAILRAVAWIKYNLETGKRNTFDFDSSIPDHNQFLSPEEIAIIEAKINTNPEFKSQNCNAVVVPAQQLVNEDNLMETNGTLSFEIVTQQEQMDTQIVPNNIVATPLVPTAIVTGVVNNSAPTSIVTGVLNSQVPVFSNWNSITGINQNVLISNVENNSELKGTSDERLGNINEAVLQPSCDQEGNVTINEECVIKKEIWIRAISKLRSGVKQVQLGKYLFEEVFTEEEVRTCQISTRNGKLLFSALKVDGIYDALAILKAIHQQESNGFQSQGTLVTKLSEAEKEQLRTKVFVEHRRYLLSKMPA